MAIEIIDAYNEVDEMYSQYGKLSALGDLSLHSNKSVIEANQIVASVSPVLSETYQNAIVG